MSKFDKALENLVLLEMDESKKVKVQQRKEILKTVSAKMKLPTIQTVSASLREEVVFWDKELKRRKKKYGRNSDQYARAVKSSTRVLDALEECLQF